MCPSFSPLQVLLGPICLGLGIDECGEQGEFHTMVVAAPRLFHGQRLLLQGDDTVVSERVSAGGALGMEWVSEDGFAFLRATNPRLVSGSTGSAV